MTGNFKRKILILFTLLFYPASVFAIQEVFLDIEDDQSALEDNTEQIELKKELTLIEKLHNIKTKEITDVSKPVYLFGEFLTKRNETGFVRNIELFGKYRGFFNESIKSDDSDFYYNIGQIEAGFRGTLKDEKTNFVTCFRFTPTHEHSFLQYMPANISVSNTSIPHHKITIGNTRTPNGIEGGLSTSLILLASRSQIARNFGNVRKLGVRVKGDYSLIDYDFGVYSSDTYFRKFFPGVEYTGMVNINPLGKTDGKYGDLKLGGWISGGKNGDNYFVSGAHAAWKYKKTDLIFEWANADGYNGMHGISTNHATGFNVTASHMLTPKLQMVARYDEFIPDKIHRSVKNREYSGGINYFIKGQALKIMLNYVFCQRDNASDSHRIILGTQILL